jgi:hypothetical protein
MLLPIPSDRRVNAVEAEFGLQSKLTASIRTLFILWSSPVIIGRLYAGAPR